MKGDIFILFTVVSGAALVPFIARRLRVPSAAFEIIYGVILFNTIVGSRPSWFGLLEEVGLIYLMFIVGMELDLRRFIKESNFHWYLIIPLLSFITVPFIFYKMGYSLFLGIAVSMVSAGIVIPVLRESKTIDTPLGRDIIGVALTGELLSILVLMGVDIYHRYGITVQAGIEGGKFLLLTLLAALFLRIVYIMAWWNPKKVENVMESEDPVEEGIRAVICIALAGAVAAYASGLEPILGSFMAGLVFSYVFKSKGRFEDKVNAVGFGFFIPFFFIGVGSHLDMHLLQSYEILSRAVFLTAMVFAGNVFPLILKPFMKIKIEGALGMCFLLSAPLSMMVVAGTLGVKMELLSEEVKDSLILAAIFSSVLYPSLFRPIARKILTDSAEKKLPQRRE